MEINEFHKRLEALLAETNQQENEHKAFTILRDFLNSEFFKDKKRRPSEVYLADLAAMPDFLVDFFQNLDGAPRELLAFMEEWREGSVFRNDESQLSSASERQSPYLIPINKLLIIDRHAYHVDQVVEDLKKAEIKDQANEGKTFTVDIDINTNRKCEIKPDQDILSYTPYQQPKARAILRQHPKTSSYISRAVHRDEGLAEEALATNSVRMAPGLSGMVRTSDRPAQRHDVMKVRGLNGKEITAPSPVLKVDLPGGKASQYEVTLSDPQALMKHFFQQHASMLQPAKGLSKVEAEMAVVLAAGSLFFVMMEPFRTKHSHDEENRSEMTPGMQR